MTTKEKTLRLTSYLIDNLRSYSGSFTIQDYVEGAKLVRELEKKSPKCHEIVLEISLTILYERYNSSEIYKDSISIPYVISIANELLNELERNPL